MPYCQSSEQREEIENGVWKETHKEEEQRKTGIWRKARKRDKERSWERDVERRHPDYLYIYRWMRERRVRLSNLIRLFPTGWVG